MTVCPIHGEVEGYTENEGALSSAYPYQVLCEECIPVSRVVGYEDEDGEEVDSLGRRIGVAL